MKNLLALIAISAFMFLGMSSLLTNKFYTSHDGFTHTARIAAYYDSLKSGQFPPRWANNFNGNLGSPIFTYSYPMPYAIGAGLHFLKIDYEDAFRIISVASYFLSGLTAYFWLKNKFSPFPATVGAIFYLFAPYRFLNIYVRAAFAENLAYTVLPLILLAVDKLFSGKKIKLWFAMLTFSVAFMLLSHNVVSAMFFPILAGYLILQTIIHKKTKPLLIGLFSIPVAFLLSAFIYLPDFFELNFVRFKEGISYYSDHFVSLGQLIYSPWGYGFDLPGFHQDDLSFQIGLANILLLFLFLSAFLILIFRKRKKLDLQELLEPLFFILVCAAIFFLVVFHPLSRPFWASFPMLKSIVDFPWRFLGLLPLAFAFFAAFVVKFRQVLTYPLGLFLIISVLIANRNHLRINEMVAFGDPVYDEYTGSATATSNEYTPYWHKSNSGIPLRTPPITPLTGDVSIKVSRRTAGELVFEARATQSATVRINRYYFPQTKITGGNWNVIKWRTAEESPGTFDDTGTIRVFIVPPGGTFKLTFSETPLRQLANFLSLVTLAVLLYFLIRNVKR